MRWLLDEMLPPLAAAELRSRGHDAVSVLEVGLGAAEEADVFARVVAEDRVLVTENFADYANLMQDRQAGHEPCLPVMFVGRAALSGRGRLAVQLAQRLDAWATENPEPFIGLYWA